MFDNLLPAVTEFVVVRSWQVWWQA